MYVLSWPDTDVCPVDGEKSPVCECCPLSCARGEHILEHRRETV